MTETLYSLTDKVLLLLEYVERSENPEELEELLADNKEALEISIDDKLEGMMTIRQNKLARVEALKAESDRLLALAKSETKQVERIEGWAEQNLSRLGYSYKDKKKKSRPIGKFNIGFKKLPPSLEIVDQAKIPEKYMNLPKTPPPAPDKKELLDMMKKKAEFLHGTKWSDKVDELQLEDFGIKMINNRQKFEVK